MSSSNKNGSKKVNTYDKATSKWIEKLRKIVCIQEQDLKLIQTDVLKRVIKVAHYVKDGGKICDLSKERDIPDLSVTLPQARASSKTGVKKPCDSRLYAKLRRETQNIITKELQDFLDGLGDEFHWLKKRKTENLSRNCVLERVYVYLVKMKEQEAIMPQGVMPPAEVTQKKASLEANRDPKEIHLVPSKEFFSDHTGCQSLTSHELFDVVKMGNISNKILPSALVASVQTSSELTKYAELTSMVFPSSSGENSNSEVLSAPLFAESDSSLYQAQFANIASNFSIL